MARAKSSALDELHALVAEVLSEQLRGEGENEPSPQMISQAIKFLKDNGIDAPASSKRFTDLTDALDGLDDEVAYHAIN